DASRRVRGAGGIFRGGILPPRKTPCIHARRPAGLVRRLRRYGGAPEIKINGNGKRHLRGSAVGRGYAPDALFAPRRRIRRRSGLRPRRALRRNPSGGSCPPAIPPKSGSRAFAP